MAGTVVTEAASRLEFDDLLAAFNAGDEHYVVPLNLTAEQFRGHLQNHDIDLDAARIAVAEGGIVGVARGWVGGVGGVLAYRGSRVLGGS